MMKNTLVLLVTSTVLAGCASSGGPPTIQSGSDAEVTFDGLYRVDNSLMAMAWMKPDTDLRGYTSIMLDRVAVAYQRDPRDRTGGRGDANFELTANQMENFRRSFEVALVEALSRDDGYRIVDAPGPEVLHITAELIDLIIRVPTEAVDARGGPFTGSYGAVTLVLEARDSQSGEIIARATDRQDPTRANTQDLTTVDLSGARTDTQGLFNYWASILRERLDALREAEIEPNQ